MRCRYCHGTESKVVDSRPTDDGTSIRRRRDTAKLGGTGDMAAYIRIV